jgi:hypothetical protein
MKTAVIYNSDTDLTMHELRAVDFKIWVLEDRARNITDQFKRREISKTAARLRTDTIEVAVRLLRASQ